MIDSTGEEVRFFSAFTQHKVGEPGTLEYRMHFKETLADGGSLIWEGVSVQFNLIISWVSQCFTQTDWTVYGCFVASHMCSHISSFYNQNHLVANLPSTAHEHATLSVLATGVRSVLAGRQWEPDLPVARHPSEERRGVRDGPSGDVADR